MEVIKKIVPIKWYSSIIFFRKIQIISDIENWVWKAKICSFCQLNSDLWYENDLRAIFDQGPKLCSEFDAEPEIRTLKVI